MRGVYGVTEQHGHSRMIRRLYDWTIRLAETRNALWALAVVSFAESSVFPIPPDVLVIPMVLANRARAFLIVMVCTAASVAGAMLGYAIGALLMESVGQAVLDFYGKADGFETFRATFEDWGAWAVLIAGITPFPFKVITITSGALHLSFPIFLLSAVIARALRFGIVAGLLYAFGPPIRDFIEKRLGLVFTVAMALLLGGFAAVRFL